MVADAIFLVLKVHGLLEKSPPSLSSDHEAAIVRLEILVDSAHRASRFLPIFNAVLRYAYYLLASLVQSYSIYVITNIKHQSMNSEARVLDNAGVSG